MTFNPVALVKGFSIFKSSCGGEVSLHMPPLTKKLCERMDLNLHLPKIRDPNLELI